MDTIAKWMLNLYPRAWRARYAEEMSAVLESHGPTWKTILDLLLGAAKAQLFWERTGLGRVQFLIGSAVLTVLCLTAYTGVQQVMRRSANFPQQTMVQQVITSLEAGAKASQVVPQQTVNVKASLDPFIIIYNNHGRAVAASVTLNGHTPTLPQGVLDYTRLYGRDVLTWQPQPDSRIAAVVAHYEANGGGFVLAGRALRVVEDRETLALHIAGMAWAVLIGAFTTGLVLHRRRCQRV